MKAPEKISAQENVRIRELEEARYGRRVAGWFTAVIGFGSVGFMIYARLVEARWSLPGLSSALLCFIIFAQMHGRVNALERSTARNDCE